MQNKFFSILGAGARLALLLGTLVFALSAQADPAGRVGRIAWLSGTVNLYNADTGESFPVPLNQPLTSGDVLTAEPNGRTEIQIGSMTVRLDSGSELELRQVDDDQVRLYLKNGRAIARLPQRDAIGDFSLETPDGRFVPRDTGVYRFDTDAESSSATVYSGALRFSSSDLSRDIDAGQTQQFWYDGQTRSRPLELVNDDFTQWSAARDRRPPGRTYARYVSPEMTGAEDLDAYGNWSDDRELGAVWFPRHVDPDWAPYRTGHWVWISPWGWNWVDNEPWGFAPFHYGRWVQLRGMWGWVPGTRVVRPVYSPAMVAWVGSGGASLSISIGSAPSVGWFPLAPREVYVPSYHTSVNYVRNVNITHVTNITNITTIVNRPQDVVRQTHYVNRNIPQAVTVVPADVVTQRRPVAAAVIAPKDRGVLRDQPIQVAAPVAAPHIERRPAPGPDPRGDARNRDDHGDRGFGRRDNPQDRNAPPGAPASTDGKPALVAPERRDVNPPRPSVQTPGPQTPGVMPQRGERPTPEVQRPAIQSRPDAVTPPAPNGRDGNPPPAPAPQRDGRPAPDVQRPAFPQRTEPPQAPSEPRNREPNTQPAPQVAPRGERPTPEVLRPSIQPKSEPSPEPVAPPRREINSPPPRIVAPERSDRPMPEVQRPAPQPRFEPPQAQPMPREAVRPPEPRQEPRPEARPSRQEERPQARPQERRPLTPEEEELLKRRRAGGQLPPQ